MIDNQVVSTMFDINTSIHMDRIVPFMFGMKTLGFFYAYTCITCLPQVVMEHMYHCIDP